MGAGSLRIAFPNVFLPPMTTIHAAVVLVTSGFFACSGGSSQPPGPPVDLVITGGNTQSWYFSNRLPTPLSVIATDPSGAGVPGVVVMWSASSGGVNPTQSTTDASGVATTIDSLGSSTTQSVTATFTGLAIVASFSEFGQAPPTAGAVAVTDFAFTPDSVVVQAGGTVTWTWNSGLTLHNVTFQSGPTIPSPSTDLSGTTTFNTTFTNVGLYIYHCTHHPISMTGKVVVVH